MSDDLPKKVKAQIRLAYTFGIIGFLSSTYVYWNEKKFTENLNKKYERLNDKVSSFSINNSNPKFKSVYIGEGKQEKILLDDSGVHIKDYMGTTSILGGSIYLKYDDSLKSTQPSFTEIRPGTIFLNVGDGTKLTRIDHSSVSIFKKNKYDTSRVRMGVVADGDGMALGLAAYRAAEGEYGKTLNGSYVSPSSVSVTDTDGNLRSIIGSVGLVKTNTGSTETTAPSTIVLFDKDGKVLYRLPAY